MLDNAIESATIEFVNAAKDSPAYRDYMFQLENVKKNSELYQKINEFRKSSFELQSQISQNDNFDKIDAFEKENQEFLENPDVNDFLVAEVAFCRMMQAANTYISEELDFE